MKRETEVEEPLSEEEEKEDKNEGEQTALLEVQDRLVRLAADFDNFRKRTMKEKSEMVKYANENLMREIVPTLDNFERAVEHVQKASDIESIRTGVELIYQQLKTTLERFGLKSQSAAGQTFDPLVHEAVSQIPSDEHPPQTVIEEHQKAYFLKDRLIRPAVVTVSRCPDATEAPDQAGTTNQESSENDTEKA